MSRFNRYSLSGEINTSVNDTQAAIAEIKSDFAALSQVVEFDELDGLTVSSTDWSFNVRPSNTEPLLRLNVEARSEEEQIGVRDLVLRILASR
jgi:phosphomannomutase